MGVVNIEIQPEIRSLAGSVFPPIRSAFFPQETYGRPRAERNFRH